MRKRYDAAYFQRWYHGARPLTRPAALRRKVALAVALAEYHLERPIRRVLDVGCGEGAWRAPLRRLRPNLDYLGLDASEYVVAHYGRSRNIRLAQFAQLGELRYDCAFDLLVCADTLHYLSAQEIRRGLSGFAELCQGVAFLEVYCREDEVEGDLDGFIPRPASWYRQAFARAGLLQCGPHTWLSPTLAPAATALERPPP